jgi:hypothetical protein
MNKAYRRTNFMAALDFWAKKSPDQKIRAQ